MVSGHAVDKKKDCIHSEVDNMNQRFGLKTSREIFQKVARPF
jgi:hypothetical protein